MANVPFPLTAEEGDYNYLKAQLYELMRQLYEDKIGGADLGDVFAIVGDVLTLVTADNSGLTKTGNKLALNLSSIGGIRVLNEALEIELVSTGGLEISAAGLGIKLDEAGTGLSLSVDGLRGSMSDPATTVTDETTFGIDPAVGNLTSFAREDHTHGTPTGITSPTQVVDFAITASKIFTKIPILEGDAWTNDSPGAGSIAWNAHTLYYNGVAYSIDASNTNLKYVYWIFGNTFYTKSDTNPTLTDVDFMIAVNLNGVHDLGWNAIANQMIGSAYIENSAIITAKINDLAVTSAKIANGNITNVQIGAGTIAAANIGNAQILSAHIGDAQILNANIGNLAVDTLKVAGDAITSVKRQIMYNGSANLTTFTSEPHWYYKTVTHNLGRRVVVQLSFNGELINTNYTRIYGLRSNDINSFVIQISNNWGSGTCYWDYW